MAFYNTEGVNKLFAEDTHTINLYSFSLNINIQFAAFITDFNDSFKSEWNQQPIFGKMDPIATFKATSRKIDLAFDIPSGNEEEAIKNLFEVDRLIRGLYPVYDEGAYLGTRTILAPPLFRMKFANLISNTDKSVKLLDNKNPTDGNEDMQKLTSGLLGYLDGFTFKPDLESGVFIVDGRIFPKLIKASLGFNVIHQHPLGSSAVSNDFLGTKMLEFAHHFSDQSKTIEELRKEVETRNAVQTDEINKLAATPSNASDGPMKGKVATAKANSNLGASALVRTTPTATPEGKIATVAVAPENAAEAGQGAIPRKAEDAGKKSTPKPEPKPADKGKTNPIDEALKSLKGGPSAVVDTPTPASRGNTPSAGTGLSLGRLTQPLAPSPTEPSTPNP